MHGRPRRRVWPISAFGLLVKRNMTKPAAPQRVLLAKIGLDGHDRGVKVVARGLRDAGYHVIYSGLWQKVESVAQASLDEDVDWLGVSILNGAHMTLVPQVLEELRRRHLTRVRVIVGGIIPGADQEKLKQMGVVACFGAGSSIDSIVEFMQPIPAARDNVAALSSRLRDGNRLALARLLTLSAAGDHVEAIKDAVKELATEGPPIVAL